MGNAAGKNILAFDLGYSSSKISSLTVRDNESIEEAISRVEVSHYPGGVQRFGATDQEAVGSIKSNQVTVDGNSYVAGVSHKTVGYDRQRSEHFIYEPEWLARFYAGLKRSGFENKEVDVLVLGLPCDHYYNKADPELKSDHVKYLEDVCSGVVDTGDGDEYLVKEVHVMAQPHGTYWGFFGKTNDEQVKSLARRGSLLVLDIGYYTFDWIYLDKLSVVLRNSSSRPNAYHQVLSIASGVIQSELRESGLSKAVVSSEDIEDALFSGERSIFVGANEVFFDDYLYKAADEVSQQVMKAIEGDVGQVPPNVIVVTGGGSKHFTPSVERWAKTIGAKVVVPDEAEKLNSFGYMVNALLSNMVA